MACRKRKMLNLEQRIDVIKQHDKGVSCRALAQTLNVGKIQIQNGAYLHVNHGNGTLSEATTNDTQTNIYYWPG